MSSSFYQTKVRSPRNQVGLKNGADNRQKNIKSRNQAQPDKIRGPHKRNSSTRYNDFSFSLSLIIDTIQQQFAKLTKVLCGSCNFKHSRHLSTLDISIKQAKTFLQDYFSLDDHPFSSQRQSLNEATEKTPYQTFLNDYYDENIMISHRGIQTQIQSMNVENLRNKNLDLKVNQAYEYFSGSNFKTSNQNLCSQDISSTEFRCDQDDTEANEDVEQNRENVRLSTIQEEIKKPFENFGFIKTSIILPKDMKVNYFNCTQGYIGRHWNPVMHKQKRSDSQLKQFQQQQQQKSVESNKENQLTRCNHSQIILRQISQDRPVSYRYDPKLNLKNRRPLSQCFVDDESQESQRYSQAGYQLDSFRRRNNQTPLIQIDGSSRLLFN